MGAFADRDSGGRGRDARSIVGVASRSTAEGLRAYNGSRIYSDWRFTVQAGAIR